MLFTFSQFDSVLKRNRQPNERLAISNINHRISMNDASDSIAGNSETVKPGGRFINVTGQRFGKLLARSFSMMEQGGKMKVFWDCLCDCGNIVKVHSGNLKNGHTASCGCLRSEVCIKLRTKHNGKRSREYRCWCHIKERCSNPKCKSYPNYGGRGIKVCERWINNFENFRADMGLCPKGLSIERKDVNGDYRPDNCIWATQAEQMNNTRKSLRITIGERTQTAAQWGREMGIGVKRVSTRIKRGWTPERAVLTPI